MWLWYAKWSTDKINCNGKEMHIEVYRTHVMIIDVQEILLLTKNISVLISKVSVSAESCKYWLTCKLLVNVHFISLQKPKSLFLNKYPILSCTAFLQIRRETTCSITHMIPVITICLLKIPSSSVWKRSQNCFHTLFLDDSGTRYWKWKVKMKKKIITARVCLPLSLTSRWIMFW